MHMILTVWTEAVDGASPTVTDHDWLIGVVTSSIIGALVTLGGVILSQRGMRRDARVTRDQTENEHADAEYPNLREQLDAMHSDIRTAVTTSAESKAAAERVEDGQRRHDSEISGLRRDIGRVQDSDARLEQRLDGLGEETRRQHDALTRRLDDHLNP